SLRATLDSVGLALAGAFAVVLVAVFFAVLAPGALVAGFFAAVLAGPAFLGAAFFSAFFLAFRPNLGISSAGQSARVSRSSGRTWAMCLGSVSTVQSSTGIGGNTATSTVPGFIVVEFREATISALRITMGTIGIPAAIAMRNGPFLKGPTSVVSTR